MEFYGMRHSIHNAIIGARMTETNSCRLQKRPTGMG